MISDSLTGGDCVWGPFDSREDGDGIPSLVSDSGCAHGASVLSNTSVPVSDARSVSRFCMKNLHSMLQHTGRGASAPETAGSRKQAAGSECLTEGHCVVFLGNEVVQEERFCANALQALGTCVGDGIPWRTADVHIRSRSLRPTGLLDKDAKDVSDQRPLLEKALPY